MIKNTFFAAGEYLSPTCRTIELIQSGRLCVDSNLNSRGEVNLSGMSDGWDSED